MSTNRPRAVRLSWNSWWRTAARKFWVREDVQGNVWDKIPEKNIREFLVGVSEGTVRGQTSSCQYSRSIYTERFIVWQPRRAADTSRNWQQSLFCCCTASMKQATDGAETAAIDGLVSS